MRKGDRVMNKYKIPRPGDESNLGTIKKINSTEVTVEMDTFDIHDQKFRTMPRHQFDVLFVEATT